jgi:NitT/TauT family transport system ATP-binding protein
VPFARPRTIEMTYAPDFVSLTHHLRDAIFSNRATKEAA